VCKPDSCVSGGSLDDRAARLKQPTRLCLFDDIKSGSIFDTATRVLEFSFTEDRTGGFGRELVELNEGCVADC